MLYAIARGAEHHLESRDWLDRQLAEALDVIERWLAYSTVVMPEPDASHVRRLDDLLATTGSAGNLVNDAHLAALALQYRATVVTYDNDFDRFPGVIWERPVADDPLR